MSQTERNRKENPAVTENYEEKLIANKRLLAQQQIIATLKTHAGWGALKESLQKKLNVVERNLDSHADYHEQGLRAMLQQRFDFKAFIGSVEDSDSHVGKISARIAELEAKIGARGSKKTE